MSFGLDLIGDKPEGDIVSITAEASGLEVRLLLLVVPRRFKLLDQIARADNSATERAHELNRPRIHPADVRVGVPLAVFHRYPVGAGQQFPHSGLQLLPAAVNGLLRAGEVIE